MSDQVIAKLNESFRLALASLFQQQGWDPALLAARAGLDPDQVLEALAPGQGLPLAAQAALAEAAGYQLEDFLALGRSLGQGRAWVDLHRPGQAVASYLSQLLKVVATFRLADGEAEFCQRVTRSLVQSFGFARAMLFLLEDARLVLRALDWPAGDAQELSRALRQAPAQWSDAWPEFDALALGRALPVAAGQCRLFGDQARARLGAAEELALAPMFTDREFIGLVVADRGPGAPALGEGDLTLLETFATLAGSLMHNQRLFAKLERKNQELSLHVRELTVVGRMTRILNQALGPEQVAAQMLALLAESLQADFGFLFLHDEEAAALRLLGSHGLEPEVVARWDILPAPELERVMARLEGPVEQTQMRPELGELAPGLKGPALVRGLRTRERLAGLWGLGRRDPGRPFMGGDERVLATSDEQMGVALNAWRLRLLATTDHLTGLYTRARFVETLEQELKLAANMGYPLSLILLDADRFKDVNDRFGHPGGDAALAGLAERLRQTTRASDTLARIGGEEFAVILPRGDRQQAGRLAERIRSSIERMEVMHRGRAIRLTASLGVATWRPEAPLSQDELVERADQALYQAKFAGRNRVELYQPGPAGQGWGSLV
ncbi:MAG: diguanylate cyclase [Thermodesulfobacteriota bacterium]